MRKFWIVMLAVGLFMAFTMPVGATDLKFSGWYKVRGLYADNPTMMKKDIYANSGSYAVYDQRLRLQPEFKIAEGLSLVMRLDVLEKLWDNQFGTKQTDTQPNTNLSWERAYVDFTTGIGRFMVGYQNFTSWGTALADGANSYPGIKYLFATGPLTVVAALERTGEGQAVTATRFNAIDADRTAYDLGFIYKWTGGEAGLMYQYGEVNTTRPAGWKTALHIFDPYVKQTFGPVYVEAEGIWLTGKAAQFESPLTGTPDVDAEQMGLYIKANVDLKPAYAGVILLWSSGDDMSDATKVKSGWLAALSAGSVFEPCLIFGSYWYNHAGTGGQQGFATGHGWTYFWDNVWFAQGYVGFKPTPKLDVFASYSWMKADQKPRAAYGPITPANPEYVSDSIGSEVDVKVTYQIFDNLSYMVGGAYFFTGDYFKGTSAANQIDNNYLILHQLDLSF